ncbi:hypothetical protein NLU13_8818 [Sarocladium strictum]|uniref:AAA+ ATPase domain-containing protein n=1 Tax=Sarocladium strictum TaxID=5046 RepID=A0AA39GB60_SARSR|nr:hypothetical protein NLU13_8818 [Sarocladium strictum]
MLPSATSEPGADMDRPRIEVRDPVENGVNQEVQEHVEDRHKSAYIRYRMEYRDRDLGDLLRRIDTTGIQMAEVEDFSLDEPVFEIITTIKAKVRNPDNPKGAEAQQVTTSLSKPRYHMNIYSPAVINALQSVVKYYPSQSLTGDSIRVDYPYCVLAHYYEELSSFKEAARAKNAADLCHLEKNVVEHLDLLLDFLDENIMTKVREEEERNLRGSYTWELAWVGRKPGRTMLIQWRGGQVDEWSATVIHSVAEGGFADPPRPWEVLSWSMVYNGRLLDRTLMSSNLPKFDGEKKPGSAFYIEKDQIRTDNLDNLPEPVKLKMKYGKQYLNLLEKQARYLKGPSRNFPYNELDGLVMVDVKDHLQEPSVVIPEVLDRSDIRPNASDGTCIFCKELQGERSGDGPRDKTAALFENYNQVLIEPEWWESNMKVDEAHIYLLCPDVVNVFVFKTRSWEPVHVRHLSEPDYDEEMIDGLVMDRGRKLTLRSLAKSFARRDQHGQNVARSMWSADFVPGKGKGLIFLLHGRPGVGKTCTAECIAAFSRRPLMILTPSDIGATPENVEENLTKMFKRAMRWETVLLIDEADVFMERRSTSDLLRNSLVAGFLRALENYDGMLFLTTNRVGAFDDAFISRVHIQLYYPEFTDRERGMLWKTFTDKLQRDRGDTIRLNIDAKEYIRGAEMRAVEWNGREIRNALQTAVALAEYDAEKDEEGKIVLTDTHLKAVVELSADFKKYLEELHSGNESKRAERKFERLDEFKRESM